MKQRQKKRTQHQEERVQKMTQIQNDGGITWIRGITIGRGSAGMISLATARKPYKRRSPYPPVMAVKSEEASRSYSLQKEREILTNISGSPHFVHCYGDEFTTGKHVMFYNVLFEHCSGGTLADWIKKLNGGGLLESIVKHYTRSILRGLNHIHSHGYVHCNINPKNIVSVPSSSFSSLRKRKNQDYIVKIGDFGLAKKAGQDYKLKIFEPCLRGTPLYMSPEYVLFNIHKPPLDIWALGCVVVEMISGKPAWNCEKDMDVNDLLHRIGFTNELPQIPSQMSKEGKDFVKRCLVLGTKSRWTAEMLLNHPFFAEDDVGSEESQKVVIMPEAAGMTPLSPFCITL